MDAIVEISIICSSARSRSAQTQVGGGCQEPGNQGNSLSFSFFVFQVNAGG